MPKRGRRDQRVTFHLAGSTDFTDPSVESPFVTIYVRLCTASGRPDRPMRVFLASSLMQVANPEEVPVACLSVRRAAPLHLSERLVSCSRP